MYNKSRETSPCIFKKKRKKGLGLRAESGPRRARVFLLSLFFVLPVSHRIALGMSGRTKGRPGGDGLRAHREEKKKKKDRDPAGTCLPFFLPFFHSRRSCIAGPFLFFFPPPFPCVAVCSLFFRATALCAPFFCPRKAFFLPSSHGADGQRKKEKHTVTIATAFFLGSFFFLCGSTQRHNGIGSSKWRPTKGTEKKRRKKT